VKLVSKIIWGILFIVVFGWALKNMHEVVLAFFMGYEIKGPLALILLGAFAAGAVLGVLAMTPTVFRHKRDLSKQKKMIAAMQKESDAQQLARIQPPQPDSIVSLQRIDTHGI
jgi:uncharacterized integral membrane protein